LNCELLLFHVVVSPSELSDDDSESGDSDENSASRAEHRRLEILRIALTKEGVNAVASVVTSNRPDDKPVDRILQEMSRLSPDLIVVGSHGHGRIHQLLAGSVADRVMRKAACPVVFVPCSRPKPHPASG
jgi:nucleotide-binding universal stress UspA family protein